MFSIRYLLPFFLLLFLPFSNAVAVTAAPSVCVVTKTIQTNQWTQIGIPCEAPAGQNTVAAIFSDDITGIYDTDWILFSFNPTTNAYEKPALTDIVEVGKGYWVLSANQSATLDMPVGSQQVSTQSSTQCLFAAGCFEVSLVANPGAVQFQMLSSPFDNSVLGETLRLNSGLVTGLTLEESETDDIFANQLWSYNGTAYDEILNQIISPWTGFWVATLPTASNSPSAKLLIPSSNYELVFTNNPLHVTAGTTPDIFYDLLTANTNLVNSDGTTLYVPFLTFDNNVVDLTVVDSYLLPVNHYDTHNRLITKDITIIVDPGVVPDYQVLFSQNPLYVEVGSDIDDLYYIIEEGIPMVVDQYGDLVNDSYAISADYWVELGDLSVAGTHNIIYTYDDDFGRTYEATLEVIVGSTPANMTPIISTLFTVNAKVGNPKTINGSTFDNGNPISYDLDGYIVSYLWTEKGVVLSTEDTFEYTPETAGQHFLTLKIVDNEGAFTLGTKTVNVTEAPNTLPTANAGADAITGVNSPNPVILEGTGSDDEGPVTYQWSENGVALANGTDATLTYLPTMVGEHILTLTVTDNNGATASDTVNVKAVGLYSISLAFDERDIDQGVSQSLFEHLIFYRNGAIRDADGDFILYANTYLGEIDLDTVGSYPIELTYTDPYGRLVKSSPIDVRINAVVELNNPTGNPTDVTFDFGNPLYIALGEYDEIFDDVYYSYLQDQMHVVNDNGDEYTMNYQNDQSNYYIYYDDYYFGGDGVVLSQEGSYLVAIIVEKETYDEATNSYSYEIVVEKQLEVIVGDEDDDGNYNTVTSHVVSTTGDALAGVRVDIIQDGVLITEDVAFETDASGNDVVGMPSDSEYTFVYTKDGYATQVVPIKTPLNSLPLNLETTMIPREPAQTIPDTGGDTGTVTGISGSTVTIPSNGFVDPQENPVSIADGITVTITPVDISNPVGVAAFPGEFTGIPENTETQSSIVSYGTVEYVFRDSNGNELQLADDQEATIEIPLFVTTRQDGSTIVAGDSIALWSLDELTGIWTQEGTGTVVVSTASPTELALQAQVSHFTWWNADAVMDPSYANVSVTATEAGTALIKVRTTGANVAGWRSGNVNTVIPLGESALLAIPSGSEVCFWAEVSYISGGRTTTEESCTTVVPDGTESVNLVAQTGQESDMVDGITQNWLKLIGTDRRDSFGAVTTDATGNIIAVGEIGSQAASQIQPYERPSITKMDGAGNVIWSNVLTSSTEGYNAIEIDSNGDIYTVGSTKATYSQYADALISKYSSGGDLLWSKTISGANNNYSTGTNYFLDLAIDSLGNVYAVGFTKSADGDITDGNAGASDTLIVKFAPDGTKVWDKTFGSTSHDRYRAVIIDGDDSLYIAGSVQEVNADISGSSLGETDILLVKLGTDGVVIWHNIYGTASYDSPVDLAQSPNGNIIMIGEMNNNEFLMELDADGIVQWQTEYADGTGNRFNSVAIDSTGNINIVGSTAMLCTNEYGECSNGLMLKYDALGNLNNRGIIGGSGYDYLYGLTIKPDDSVIAVGSSRSNDGVFSQNNGRADSLILSYH